MKPWQHDYDPADPQYKKFDRARTIRGMITVKSHVVLELQKGIECLVYHGTTEIEQQAKRILIDKFETTHLEYTLLNEEYARVFKKDNPGVTQEWFGMSIELKDYK